MIKMIYKKRNEKNDWNRYFVKTKGDICSTDFYNPIGDDKVNLEPVTKKLYLLDTLMFSIPKEVTTLTFQTVLDEIPQEISKDVIAVEFIYIFEGVWELSLFSNEKMYGPVAWVALLTEKDTGRALLPVKMTKENSPETKPIGTTDEEWDRIQREFNLK